MSIYIYICILITPKDEYVFQLCNHLGLTPQHFTQRFTQRFIYTGAFLLFFLAVAILLIEEILHQLVDGTHYNPIICSVFIVPNNYQLVQDFFHPQYQTKMAVHSRFKVPDVSKSHVISTNIYICIYIYCIYYIYVCA